MRGVFMNVRQNCFTYEAAMSLRNICIDLGNGQCKQYPNVKALFKSVGRVYFERRYPSHSYVLMTEDNQKFNLRCALGHAFAVFSHTQELFIYRQNQVPYVRAKNRRKFLRHFTHGLGQKGLLKEKKKECDFKDNQQEALEWGCRLKKRRIFGYIPEVLDDIPYVKNQKSWKSFRSQQWR